MKHLKTSRIIASIILIMFTACSRSGKVKQPIQSVKVELPANSGSIAQRTSAILAREITERSGAKVSTEGKAEFTVELVIEPGVGAEGFTIADNGSDSIKITGNDENGLLYGVGKFLHTSRYDQGGFTPGDWRGTSVPKGTMRGIYLATHFNNYYEAASNEERLQYIESLALWGTNSLIVHYPNQWFTGYDDPKSIEWFGKIKRLLEDAKSVGIKVGILQCANAGFTSAPKELLAAPSKRVWGQMLCPSKPAAEKILLTDWGRLLDQFNDTGLDLVVYWPYDEGGCACDQCAPWGANGYPNLCRNFSSMVRAKYPDAKIILSTWFFDDEKKGDYTEYLGLNEFLKTDKNWLDYLMVDGHHDFPEYVLKQGTPGGLPMVNFPEISMWGTDPIWGGYGANPLPLRFQSLWDRVKGNVDGGFPYSEGIYEDMNKVVCSQFFWNPGQTASETVREYIAYEFSPSVVDSVLKAIQILDKNLPRQMTVRKTSPENGQWNDPGAYTGGSRIAFTHADKSPLTVPEQQELAKSTDEAFRLLQQANDQLPATAKASWRWRILYLRALVDYELVKNNGWFQGTELQSAFRELTDIYRGENAFRCIHVPKIDDANAKFSQQPDK